MCCILFYLSYFGVPVHRSSGLVFIHIPKTAGTSIESSIDLDGDWRIEDQDRLFGKISSRRILRKNFSSNFLQHLNFREISLLLGGRIDGFKIFSVVRDPWARFLSSYKRKDPDLCEFVKWRSSQNIESFSLDEYSKLLRWVRHPHLNTQSSFLSGFPGISLIHVLRFLSLRSCICSRIGCQIIYSARFLSRGNSFLCAICLN